VGAETAGSAPEQFASARVLAELGHRDAAKGKRRRVLAQGDPLESAERIAGDESTRGSGDQGVHPHRLLRARRASFDGCAGGPGGECQNRAMVSGAHLKYAVRTDP
jgi:hypothetical protein